MSVPPGERDGAPAEVEAVYEDRNRLVLLAARLAREAGYAVGWREDPQEPGWPVIYIELGQGQVSWHIPATLPTAFMPRHGRAWDGHTNEEKAARIMAYLAADQRQAPSGP